MDEIYGNKPADISENDVTFKYTNALPTDIPLTASDTFLTMENITITINKIDDLDDYYPMLYAKVLLVPRSYVLGNLPRNLSIDVSALELFAQLPGDTIILYSNNMVKINSDNTITLAEIYIPPLVIGEKVIS